MQLDLRYLAFAAAATGDSDDEDDHYKDDGRGQGQGQGGRGGRTLQRGFCIVAPRMTQPPPPQPPLPPPGAAALDGCRAVPLDVLVVDHRPPAGRLKPGDPYAPRPAAGLPAGAAVACIVACGFCRTKADCSDSGLSIVLLQADLPSLVSLRVDYLPAEPRQIALILA